MFQSYLLKGALSALAVIEMSARAAISQDDLLAYPEFADVMATSGMGFEWVSHTVVSRRGYENKMFRITADASGTPLVPSKGPVLLLHGLYSEPLDFFNRSDELAAGLPV